MASALALPARSLAHRNLGSRVGAVAAFFATPAHDAHPVSRRHAIGAQSAGRATRRGGDRGRGRGVARRGRGELLRHGVVGAIVAGILCFAGIRRDVLRSDRGRGRGHRDAAQHLRAPRGRASPSRRSCWVARTGDRRWQGARARPGGQLGQRAGRDGAERRRASRCGAPAACYRAATAGVVAREVPASELVRPIRLTPDPRGINCSRNETRSFRSAARAHNRARCAGVAGSAPGRAYPPAARNRLRERPGSTFELVARDGDLAGEIAHAALLVGETVGGKTGQLPSRLGRLRFMQPRRI